MKKKQAREVYGKNVVDIDIAYFCTQNCKKCSRTFLFEKI